MRKLLLFLTLLAGSVSQAFAADNYTATAGSGLTFGAKDAAGVLYSRFIGCDNTTVSRCWTVDASGNLSVNVSNTLTTVTPGDSITTGTYASGSPVIGVPLLWNGTTYDRWKSSGTGFAAVNPGTAANWGVGATAAAVPANAIYLGFNSGGNLVGPATATPLPVRQSDGTRQVVLDPCEANAQTYAPISITTATTTQIVAASASNKTYICSLFLTSAAADNVGIVEGTGGTCGTGTAGVVGGTTAANGPNFAANGGVLLQAGGKTAVAQTAGTNVGLCLITSAATPLAGGIRYVQAP